MFGLREIKEMREKGITLVALVITIVILLIFAGISISTLTNTGIFQKAKEAKQKSEEAENEQNKILDEYETELNQYNENTLVYKVNNGIVKIGDYVAYTPDDASTKEILEELGNYSGSKENTNLTLTQEKNLKWRVLDVKDGCVRLISEMPTTSLITLKGAMGYNNAVKLLDDACSSLYNNSSFTNKVQNLKIEDIQDKMLEKDYKKFDDNYGERFTTGTKYYPSILLNEMEQKVTINKDVIIGEKLDLSEQKNLVNQLDKLQAISLNVKYSYWGKKMTQNDFIDNEFYEIFINNGKNYDTYWLSSRCVDAFNTEAGFNIRYIESGGVYAHCLYISDEKVRSFGYALRPVVTLNSGVQLDATKVADGSDADHAYAIK